jgi:multiple sugar transport system ATP-binding protein
MRAEIARLQHELGVTTIYVTHDQTEAMTMGDRVAVMRRGLLQQVDNPQTLYEKPVNLFVAGFIGSPAMNLLEASLAPHDGSLAVELGGFRLPVPPEVVAERPGLRAFQGRKIILGIRPEDMEDASISSAGDESPCLSAVVDIREDLGSEVFVHFRVDAPALRGEDVRAAVGEEGLVAAAYADGGSVFVARVDRESRAREGDAVTLSVDARRLHFFDIDSGNAV